MVQGEIAQAAGNVQTEDERTYGETLLFTTSESVLQACASNDMLLHETDQLSKSMHRLSMLDAPDSRPSTAESADGDLDTGQLLVPRLALVPDESVVLSSGDGCAFRGQVRCLMCAGLTSDRQVVQFVFTQTWGDMFYLGLTAIELVASGRSNS